MPHPEQAMAPVRFRFQNIGPVHDAKLELGNLTIITGRNNTGKTYLAYTIYGFMKCFQNSPANMPKASVIDHKLLDVLSQTIQQSGVADWPLNSEKFQQDRKFLASRFSYMFSNHYLADIFNASHDEFKDTFVSVVLPKYEPTTRYNFRPTLHDLEGFSLYYDGEKISISFERSPEIPFRIRRQIAEVYRHFLAPELLGNISIISAERFGISLFYKELDFAKNQLIEVLQRFGDKKNLDDSFPYMLLEQASSRYAVSIRDNTHFTRSIAQMQSQRSQLSNEQLFSRIETLMEGGYSISNDEIRFASKPDVDQQEFDVPLHRASSSARGLSDLYFFLKHQASHHHLLIIDEPESHLDTGNQIQLARMLAHFVRAGIRVLVTTHSDYLLKEINNLIMLNNDFKDKSEVIKSLGYSQEDSIDPKLIRAYIAENGGLTACEIDKFGIELPLYDKVINKINYASNELSSRVSD